MPADDERSSVLPYMPEDLQERHLSLLITTRAVYSRDVRHEEVPCLVMNGKVCTLEFYYEPWKESKASYR